MATSRCTCKRLLLCTRNDSCIGLLLCPGWCCNQAHGEEHRVRDDVVMPLKSGNIKTLKSCFEGFYVSGHAVPPSDKYSPACGILSHLMGCRASQKSPIARQYDSTRHCPEQSVAGIILRLNFTEGPSEMVYAQCRRSPAGICSHDRAPWSAISTQPPGRSLGAAAG